MNFPHYELVPKVLGANLDWRRDVLIAASEDPDFARSLVRMCAEDMLFYVNGFCWTYDPRVVGGSEVPFLTYGFQDEAMSEILWCVENGQDFAMPKSRDMGASWMGLTVFEWLWHFRSHQSFLLISRNEDYMDKAGNSKSLFWKIDFLHEHQPRWLLPTGRWLGWDDPNRKLLHLRNPDNGSSIDGESTTGDAGRGDRRTAMFIDEHAAFEVTDGFRILRATRDTTRCRGFNSTPQGANNGFYEVVHNTSAKVIRLHWSRHPEKNRGLYTTGEDGLVKLLDEFRGVVEQRVKGEKEGRKVQFPDGYTFRLDGKTRSPWYDNECARCVSETEVGQELDIDFLGSDYQFFDAAAIEALRQKYCRPALWVGDIEIDEETCEPKRLVEDPNGHLHLWLTLDGNGRVSADRRFILGADVSAGTGASNSVCSVADPLTGEKLAVYRNANIRPNGFARVCMGLAKFFNRGLLIWDASGPTGEVFTKRVIAVGYGHVYYRRQEKRVGGNVTDQPGYHLTPQARTALFEDYRDALSKHAFINRSEPGMKECLQFVRRADGSIEHSAAANTQDPSGARTAHGDEVVADALVSYVLSDRGSLAQAKEPEIPEGSLAWRRKRQADAQAKSGVDKLPNGW